MSHTKEPWTFGGSPVSGKDDLLRIFKESVDVHVGPIGEYFCEVATIDGLRIAFIAGPTGEENARRIVACVNACAGINTEDLERYYNAGGGIDEALEEASLCAHVKAVQQRDELLKARQVLGAEVATLRQQCDELLEALHLALPFVEDHEGADTYKPGAVTKAVNSIRAAIDLAKGGAACN